MSRVWFTLVCAFITLIKTGLVSSSMYLCENGKTQAIAGQARGTIKTRQADTGFYTNNLKCSWQLDAGEGRFIKLNIDVADLQWSPQYTTCSGYDNLQIIEGETIEGKGIASVCGARNPYNVISKGRYLFLQFFSTHQNFGNHRGVEISFETFENQTCAPGWVQPARDPDMCYMIGLTGNASWSGSQDICTYSLSNLVSIANEAVYQTILELGRNHSVPSVWVGLSDTLKEGTFSWLDTASYPFVRTISGNNYRKHCVSVDVAKDEWIVKECDRTLLNYICKAKKDGSTILYSAEPSSVPPDEVDESNNTYLIVIFTIGGLLFIAGLILFVCCCVLKRQDRPCCRSVSQPDERHVEYSPVNQNRVPDDAPPTYKDVIENNVV